VVDEVLRFTEAPTASIMAAGMLAPASRVAAASTAATTVEDPTSTTEAEVPWSLTELFLAFKTKVHHTSACEVRALNLLLDQLVL